MNKQEVKARIEEIGIVPAIRLPSREDAVFAIESIHKAGIPVAEVTLTIPGAIEAISELAGTGQPVWIADLSAPNDLRINPAAFIATGNQGNLGRNAIAGFGMSQLDLALRRDFALAERRSVEFRVDAFNAFNHPNFADSIRFLVSTLFDESPSMLNLMLGSGSPGRGLSPALQMGGARTLQLGLRFRF